MVRTEGAATADRGRGHSATEEGAASWTQLQQEVRPAGPRAGDIHVNTNARG